MLANLKARRYWGEALLLRLLVLVWGSKSRVRDVVVEGVPVLPTFDHAYRGMNSLVRDGVSCIHKKMERKYG